MKSQDPVFGSTPSNEISLEFALYERVVENSPDMISIVDRGYVYRMVNSAYLKYYRRTKEEIVGRRAAEILGDDIFEEIIRPHFDRCFAGETVNYQSWFRHHELGERYMDVHYYPLPGENGDIKQVAVVVRDMTEHERAEEALRKSEARYRLLAENIKDVIWTMDLETMKFTYISPSTTSLRGFSAEEVMAQKLDECLTPPAYQRAMEILGRELTRENIERGRLRESYVLELEEICKDGSTVYTEETMTVLFNEEGRPTEILGVTHNITDRKRALEALRASEERYRMLVEEAKDIIYTLELATGRIASVNSYAEEALGYARDEILNMPHFLNITHPDERQTLALRLQQVLAGEDRIHNFPMRLQKADGTYLDVENNWAAIADSEGHPQYFVGIARDVTERKRMQETLRLSEERYHKILDSSHDMIIVLDADARMLFANESWHRDASYDLEEIGRIDIFDTIHPDDRERVKGWFRKVLAGESALNVDYRALTKDAGLKWIEVNASAINWAGAEKAIVVTARDITKRRRAEKALERSLSLLSATLESTADGILAIGMDGEITNFNQKFMEIWQIPESVMAARNDRLAVEYVLDQLVDPEDFLKKVGPTYDQTTADGFATLEFKNGRVVEHYSKPQEVGGEVVGKVLSFRDITARREAEEALRQSEEKYRSIFWEAPDIFYTLDLDTWVVTDANKYALEALEYAPDYLGKMHIVDIIHPDDFDRVIHRLREMVENKDRMPHFPLRILTRTGKVLHIEQSGVIFWDENGAARTFLGLAHDVTYRTEQEETIRKRNERIAALYEVARAANESLHLDKFVDLMMKIVPQVTDSATTAIFVLNDETQLYEYVAHYGLDEKTVEATNHLKPDEGIHGYVAEHKRPILIQDVKSHPLLSRSAQVNELDIESSIVAPLIFEDDVIGFMSVSREPGNPYDTDDLDLVSAMANNIAIAMANAKLYSQVLQRETRLETIIETSKDGIAVISSDRYVEYRNSTMSSLFGLDRSEDIRNLITDAFFAPESLHVLEDIRGKLERGEEISESMHFKGKRKDGNTFDAELRLGSFFENGKRHSVAIIRDVTERNRLRFQLEQSGKLAAIGELAAGVAHEINNPIATLDIQTGLMRDILDDWQDKLDDSLSRQIEEYLGIVENQIQRCQSVTNNLLSFSRSPEGITETFEINDLLRKTVALVASLTDKRPRIDLELDEQLPPFLGNPNRLEQVFVNLLGNAVKAIPAGGSIKIASSRDPGDNIRIDFRDSGPGIAPDVKKRIFDPFFTTDAAKGGTGLGLSISYYIIKELNGSIDVESHPGKGATFSITLPAHGAEEEGGHHD